MIVYVSGSYEFNWNVLFLICLMIIITKLSVGLNNIFVSDLV